MVLKNILDDPEKYLNLSGGILNFHSHYKLAEIFEYNAKSNVSPLTNLTDFPNLIYMQWLTYFLNGKYEDSKSILVDNASLICDLLIEEEFVQNTFTSSRIDWPTLVFQLPLSDFLLQSQQ